jgi:hypothetical protein
MKKSSKVKCKSCRHRICQVCGGCHHPTCKKTVRLFNGRFNQLLTPELSQVRESTKTPLWSPDLQVTNGKVHNLIKIERSDARKEALEEVKAAVEFADVAVEKVGTFKDGHDMLKAQILYLLRSKLDQ